MIKIFCNDLLDRHDVDVEEFLLGERDNSAVDLRRCTETLSQQHCNGLQRFRWRVKNKGGRARRENESRTKWRHGHNAS